MTSESVNRGWAPVLAIAAVWLAPWTGPRGGEVRADAPAPAQGCLAQARRALTGHGSRFEQLEVEVVLGVTATWSAPTPAPTFAAFEGRWRGAWRGTPTTHVWRSVDRHTQLVVIRDGDVLRRGVNLASAPGAVRGGAVCGVVEEPRGDDRLHVGQPLGRGAIRWWTPFGRYDERATTEPGGRVEYAIDFRPHAPGEPAYAARYRPWAPVAARTRRATLAGVTATWRVDGDRVHVLLRARTRGWIAFGVGRDGGLVGTRFVLARVVDGRAQAESHVALASGPVSLRALGLRDDLRDVAGRERGGETTVAFSMPRLAPDDGMGTVHAGARGTLWLAASDRDAWSAHSHRREAATVRW